MATTARCVIALCMSVSIMLHTLTYCCCFSETMSAVLLVPTSMLHTASPQSSLSSVHSLTPSSIALLAMQQLA